MKKSNPNKRHMSDPRNKRQHILDAAYIVFSRKGFHRATVDEIIALADTGKGTVYNYFVNKEQLFYTLVKEHSDPFHKKIEEIVASDLLAIEKIAIMTKVFLEFYSKNADLWRVLLHEMRAFGEAGCSELDKDQHEKYKKNFEDTINLLEVVLTQGIEQNSIHECNTKLAAYGLFSAIIAIVFQDLVGDDMEVTAQKIANTFLFGIAIQSPKKT
ncbi:TetR/AcrR family transcriptional regulator [Anaerosinus massiliensis]|uniref:TetR/AcrR family transcriptional regulator n=1 Tax=Massilibacillus massiliensis TaxID=1806837 RepID=UPI000A641686|nr:TetR/AcrR family transcriptional regulator [Massilibacillus massiliensis]